MQVLLTNLLRACTRSHFHPPELIPSTKIGPAFRGQTWEGRH